MNNLSVIKSNIIRSQHGFSTRIGGVSTGYYASLNLGMNRNDDRELVTKNWDIFLAESGITQKEFVCGKQVHGNNVHIATAKDLRPAFGPGELIEADGYVTNEINVPLAIFIADCIPLLLEDSEAGVVGAIHCGWRPTVADIEGAAIDKMCSLGAHIEHIKAALGPCIEKCCFEVGKEVIEAAENLVKQDINQLYDKKDNGKYMLDLKGVLKLRLLQLGLKEENIDLVGQCTMCHPDLFYSHRLGLPERGSMACVISL